MKLSMESFSVAERFGERDGLTLLREAGFDGVDMSYYWTREGTELLGDDYLTIAHDLRRHLDGLGLACLQAHAPFSFRYGMALQPEEPVMRAILRAMESAAVLGAPHIIVHSIRLPQEATVSEWDYNLAFYRTLLPYCERFGICVAVENLFRRNDERIPQPEILSTPEALSRFVRELASPLAIACVDTGHAAITGTAPEVFLAGMDSGLLGALHIQDGDTRDDRHLLPFHGEYDWGAIMATLRRIGYRGDLTLEIYKFLRGTPNDLLPAALRLIERTGRHLISLFEQAEEGNA